MTKSHPIKHLALTWLLQKSILIYRIRRKLLQNKYFQLYKIQQLEFGLYKSNVQFERIETYATPRNFSHFNRNFGETEHRSYPARYVYKVKNVVLDTVTGHIFAADQSLILESSTWTKSWHISGSAPRVISKPISSKFIKDYPAESIVLPSNSFFHWVSEDLGPFLFIQKIRPLYKILVYKNADKYVKDFLVENNFHFDLVDRYIKFKEYEFISKCQDNSWPDPKDISVIREDILANQVKPEMITGEFLYISRLNSSRSPSFEKELEDKLLKNGWRIIYAEDLGFTQQVYNFGSAAVIAGVQGAGLVGTAWSKPGCKVIEIFDLDWRYTPVVARLAAIAGAEFHSIGFKRMDSNTALTIFDELNRITKVF